MQGWAINDLIYNQANSIGSLPMTANPAITPNGGSYSSAPLVTISTTTPGSVVYYTLDGSEPTGSSTLYTVPFIVGSTCTLKCIAVAPGFAPSAVVSAAFTITTPKVGTPVFSPVAGTYPTSQIVTITATNAEYIRYTTDGSTPTGSSPLYSGALTISATTPLQAKGTAPGYLDSDVAAGVYTIGSAVVADPVPNPPTGAFFSGVLEISATCATSGALIYYTTDGSTPTQSSTLYSVPIPIALTTTFKFKAFKTGYTPSGVVTAVYTLNTVDMDGWWGSSVVQTILSPSQMSNLTPWTRTLENMWTTPFVMNFNSSPPEFGPYRFYICQNSAPPIESGTQGIFALSPADFCNTGLYLQTDANGWPCFIPESSIYPYPYREYRLKNAINGAFTLTIQHKNEAP